MHLSSVHSSLWQWRCRCRGAQLSLRQAQDGLLCCWVLICSCSASIISEYLVTLLKRSLSSAKNPNVGGVLKPPCKLGMQHKAPVFPVRILTAPPTTHHSAWEMLPLSRPRFFKFSSLPEGSIVFWFCFLWFAFFVWLVGLGFLFVCGLRFCCCCLVWFCGFFFHFVCLIWFFLQRWYQEPTFVGTVILITSSSAINYCKSTFGFGFFVEKHVIYIQPSFLSYNLGLHSLFWGSEMFT